MTNRRLSKEELTLAHELLTEIRMRLEQLSGGEAELLFAYRRKVFKELTYDERSKPMVRRRLKLLKFTEQRGICPVCERSLPTKNAVLDRFRAIDGYTTGNTRLIHVECDAQVQDSRRYREESA